MKTGKRLLLIAMVVAGHAVAATISIMPAGQTVLPGTPASIDISISGLGDGFPPSLGVYDLTITFDPAILSFSSVSWGSGLDVLGLGSIQSATPGTGSINLFELSLDQASDLNSLQPASFPLFTLHFGTLGVGTSPLTLSLNALGDADGAPIAADLANGAITVSSGDAAPVPEPSTTVLLALLFSIAVVRRVVTP